MAPRTAFDPRLFVSSDVAEDREDRPDQQRRDPDPMHEGVHDSSPGPAGDQRNRIDGKRQRRDRTQ